MKVSLKGLPHDPPKKKIPQPTKYTEHNGLWVSLETHPPDLSSPPLPLYPMAHSLSDHCLSPSCLAFLRSLDFISIPSTVDKALKNLDWCHAMAKDFNAPEKNQTRILITLTSNHNAVACKWVHKFSINLSIGKLVRLPRIVLSTRVPSTRGPLPQETKLTQFTFFFHCLLTLAWPCNNFMSRMPSCMGTLKRIPMWCFLSCTRSPHQLQLFFTATMFSTTSNSHLTLIVLTSLS